MKSHDAGGPPLRVSTLDRAKWVLMQFPGTERSVLSGLMRGVREIHGRPAIADVPVGAGCAFRDQPLLSLAESGRIQYAGERHSLLEQR